MRVSSVEITGYAGIGSDPVVLKPLRKVNVLVGANCAGKSGILRALRYVNICGHVRMSPAEYHGLTKKVPFSICVLRYL